MSRNTITDLLHSQNEDFDSYQIPGFVQGIVVENNNSKFKGMVKVEFTVWEKNKNICEWVRLISPYTGKDYGSYVVPEINEVVLVGFIGGSLKRPFLLGSLYPSDAKIVSESFTSKNEKKRLKTKGGIVAELLDTEGKQGISLTTPKGSKIVVEDEKETCLISDKNGKNKLLFDFKKGTLSLLAAKKIELKAGSASLVLDGNKNAAALKAQTVEVKAGNSVKVEGTTKADFKGGMTSIAGTQKMDVKGGLTSVTGQMVKIN